MMLSYLRMFSSFIRKALSLELEEKILNSMLILSMVAVALPWIGGKLSLIDDQTVTYSGFGFYVSFMGYVIFGLVLFTLLITAIPLLSGNHLVKREHKNAIRLSCCALSTILILCALSVLVKVTFTSPGMEVRFGIYIALIASMIATLYSFLSMQEEKKRETQQLFHQQSSHSLQKETNVPAPPEPELHGQIHR